MKKPAILNKNSIAMLLFALLILGGCGYEKVELPPGYHEVKVLEKIDTDKYTYFRVSEDNQEYWIAANLMKADKGDKLYFSRSMQMTDFKSETLDRTFPKIWFVEDLSDTPPAKGNDMTGENAEGTDAQSHPQVEINKDESLSVKPVSGGFTIEQLYQKKNELAGQTVKVRGKVTKFNMEILNRNWIHIQDGTGGKDSYDLTITCDEIVKVGDIITVEGKVVLNRDFGAGYNYDLMLEEGKILKVDNNKSI